MRRIIATAFCMASLAFGGNVWAYGGGGGGHNTGGCTNPGFMKQSLADGATVKSVESFSFMATPNTVPGSISVTFGKEPGKVEIKKQPSGYLDVVATAGSAIQDKGKARIAIEAKSDDGCPVVEVYWLNVNPDAP